MTPFVAEYIGTAIMILMGGGVVANAVLEKTKGNNHPGQSRGRKFTEGNQR